MSLFRDGRILNLILLGLGGGRGENIEVEIVKFIFLSFLEFNSLNWFFFLVNLFYIGCGVGWLGVVRLWGLIFF